MYERVSYSSGQFTKSQNHKINRLATFSTFGCLLRLEASTQPRLGSLTPHRRGIRSPYYLGVHIISQWGTCYARKMSFSDLEKSDCGLKEAKMRPLWLQPFLAFPSPRTS